MWRKKYKKGPDLNFFIFIFFLATAIRWPLILVAVILVLLTVWYIKKKQLENFSLTPFPVIGDDYIDYIPQSLEDDRDSFSSYKKKKSHITKAEMVFYNTLKEAVQDKYDIQRQVVLSSIVDVTSPNKIDYQTKRQFNPDRSKIDRKTVDFVLFDKETLEPFMAIELDDSSHESHLREERDRFVDAIMEKVGLRIEHVKTAYSYNKEDLMNLVG